MPTNPKLTINSAFKEFNAEDDPFQPDELLLSPTEPPPSYYNSSSQSSGPSTPLETFSPPPETSAPLTSAGILPDSLYEKLLPRWRYEIRKVFLKSLELECPNLKIIQDSMRSPLGDWWFGMAALLGTHTFFMVFIPLFFWFFQPHLGASIFHSLTLGIYFSSFMKDLLCVPRPYVPPVQRLLTGGMTHHLEYGFPSTHSTNAVSMTLFLSTALWDCPISRELKIAGSVLLGVYVTSVVVCRLYCGMHSIVDCLGGVLLGAFVWILILKFEEPMVSWVYSGSWQVPLVSTPLALFLVSVHPEPVDDCPCFEDAIAVIAVSLGLILGAWQINKWDIDIGNFTFGSPLVNDENSNIFVFLACCVGKVALGIGAIFLWRLGAKQLFHFILPPTFRFFTPYFTLPRRHYTQATEYLKYENSESDLHPVPSMINLPSLNAEGGLLHSEEMSWEGKQVLRRKRKGGEKVKESENKEKDWEKGIEPPKKKIKHYDADVLTKVGVYSGIGWIAYLGIRVTFKMVGLDQ